MRFRCFRGWPTYAVVCFFLIFFGLIVLFVLEVGFHFDLTEFRAFAGWAVGLLLSVVIPVYQEKRVKRVVGMDIERIPIGKFNNICACLDYWISNRRHERLVDFHYGLDGLQQKLLNNSIPDYGDGVVLVRLDLQDTIVMHEIYGMYVAGLPVQAELLEHNYIADIRASKRKSVAGVDVVNQNLGK